MKSPLVSVIIPNYNYARFLPKRMESVLGQTYSNLEVIILDDCSTDDSMSVIESFRQDSRIKTVIRNQSNSGNPAAQWIKGLEMATGEYVWIAEADDWCKENMLETLVSAMLSNPRCSYAFCRSLIIDDDDNVIARPVFKRKEDIQMSGKDYVRRFLFAGCDVANASSALIRKSAALCTIPNGVWTGMKRDSDYMFWVEMAAEGDVAIISEPLNCFRKHLGTFTALHGVDGSNTVADKQIFDYISKEFKLPLWRRLVGSALRRRLIRKAPFESEEIRKQMLEMWHSPLSPLDTIITKAYFLLSKDV